MATRKQERAERRIERARSRKAQRAQGFAYKVARRRVKNPEDRRRLIKGFCCKPASLDMDTEDLLSKGQQLVGGTAVFFDRGELAELLPGWRCESRQDPVVLMANEVRSQYQEDGHRESSEGEYHPTTGRLGSSGSSLNW